MCKTTETQVIQRSIEARFKDSLTLERTIRQQAERNWKTHFSGLKAKEIIEQETSIMLSYWEQ